MQKKTLRLIIILLIGGVFIAAASTTTWYMSHGTVKVSLNVPADSLMLKNADNKMVGISCGLQELESSFLPSGKYTIIAASQGYKKVVKEVQLGWSSEINEQLELQDDAEMMAKRAEDATALLSGIWKGKFGKVGILLNVREVTADGITGFDKIDGNLREIKGEWKYNKQEYEMILKEPGDISEDGEFVLVVKEGSDTANGSWESFDKSTKFSLQLIKIAGSGTVNSKNTNSNNQQLGDDQVASQKPMLTILRAIYGSSFKNSNVTAQLNAKITNHNNIYVEVSNRTFGDPDPGRPKQLTVSYEYKGMVYNKILRENQIFRVP